MAVTPAYITKYEGDIGSSTFTQAITVIAGTAVVIAVENNNSATPTSFTLGGVGGSLDVTVKNNNGNVCSWISFAAPGSSGSLSLVINHDAAIGNYTFAQYGALGISRPPLATASAGSGAGSSQSNLNVTPTTTVGGVSFVNGNSFDSTDTLTSATSGFTVQTGGHHFFDPISAYKVSASTTEVCSINSASGSLMCIAAVTYSEAGGGGGSVQPPRSMHQFRQRAA